MPESRNRHKHHHHHHHDAHQQQSHAKPKRNAATVLAILAALLGLAVAYFTQGADVFWMITGLLAGAVIGYLVGRNMDKALANSK